MTLDEIKRLIEFIREQNLTEFEFEHDGVKLRVKTGAVTHATVPMTPGVPAPAVPVAAPLVSAATLAALPPPAAEAEDEGTELAIVKSPIVGTFYRSAEPDAAPLVDVGSMVRKSQVLCIIEAMKLMNEIDSEYEGEITNVYVENGQPVQYGERLFAIRLKA